MSDKGLNNLFTIDGAVELNLTVSFDCHNVSVNVKSIIDQYFQVGVLCGEIQR